MAQYLWQVTFNGGALASQGVAVSQGLFYYSIYAVVTQGFIYGNSVVWNPVEGCQGVSWTILDDCETSTWTPL